MLVGLQGSGKTTHAGKLANHLRKQGRNPVMVAADVYRPAAITQLETLGRQLNVPVYSEGPDQPPLRIVQNALRAARDKGQNPIIIDTAGRLQIDERMMAELETLEREVRPTEILLVVDAMTGQEAVNVSQEFARRLGVTGLILTKMDGDARGGAALSIRSVTGIPIKFIGTGERMDAIEPFYPDRLASRILGMGDVLSLIEKVQAEVDEEKALELQEKMERNAFTLEDFRDQLGQMKKLGSLENILSLLPGEMFKGMPKMTPEMTSQMEKELKRTEAIINSMTPGEREDHLIINASRRKRIALGSGTTINDVNRLLKQYVEMKTMMQQLMQGNGMLGGLKGKVVRKLTGVGVRKKKKEKKRKKRR
jgi:signal recognition particle subunit SRP54